MYAGILAGCIAVLLLVILILCFPRLAAVLACGMLGKWQSGTIHPVNERYRRGSRKAVHSGCCTTFLFCSIANSIRGKQRKLDDPPEHQILPVANASWPTGTLLHARVCPRKLQLQPLVPPRPDRPGDTRKCAA